MNRKKIFKKKPIPPNNRERKRPKRMVTNNVKIFAEYDFCAIFAHMELIFTEAERKEALQLSNQLADLLKPTLREGDKQLMESLIEQPNEDGHMQRDIFGLNPVLHSFRTAVIAVEEEGLKRDGAIATLLYTSVINGAADLEQIAQTQGKAVATIIHGLVRIQELYKKNPDSFALDLEFKLMQDGSGRKLFLKQIRPYIM